MDPMYAIALAPAVVLLAALLNSLFGRQYSGDAGGILGTGASGLAFVLVLLTFIGFGGSAAEAVRLPLWDWLPGISSGFTVDQLSLPFALVITGVGFLINLYSIGYMKGDPGLPRYFAGLNLFIAAMLVLVLADSLVLMFLGWEGVGVCSYLLIGFWYRDRLNASAARKAFIVNRVGDVGFLLAMFMTYRTFGTLEISAVMQAAPALAYGSATLTLIGVLYMLAAAGKSAQLPLHTWLPDAMAGPTPVSSLIHAATMVTAGVFMIARLYPAYYASTTAMTVVAVVGAITLLVCGLLALVQDDVKKVLAYSTVSQLGYMVAALAFSYTAGLFHLFTHGFFKALLFMGAGSLIHAAHSNNRSDMGGLGKPMPRTFWTFLIGSLALMAIPPFAGFWSKDEVLVGALTDGSGLGWTVLAVASVGVFITAFYMTRVLYLVFAGDFRGHGTPHESPASMTWPLVGLAVPSALIGLVNLPFAFAHANWFTAWTMPSVDYFFANPPHFSLPLALVATAVALLAIALGRFLYRDAPVMSDDPTLNMGWLSHLLVNKYYLDVLWTDVVAKGAIRGRLAPAAYWFNDHVLGRVVYLTGAGIQRTGQFMYHVVDQKGIDGFINGLGLSARWSSAKVRLAQSGNVQLYAGAMFVGVFVLAIAFATA